MDKKSLLALVIEELAKQKRDLIARADETHQMAKEAPSPMESNSDRTRYEMNTLAGNLRDVITRYDATEKALSAFTPPEHMDIIGLGAIVVIENAKKMTSNVFLLPDVGNIPVKLHGTVYASISPDTPLGAGLMGHRAGERVTVNDRETAIISVQ